MIGNNFPIKAITENCGNKYITILHNSPNEKILKTLKNSAFKQIWRINISHFKCWKLASVTSPPVCHCLWRTPTTDVGHIWLTSR